MNNNACFQCGSRPINGMYPHLRPAADSYAFCTCSAPNRRDMNTVPPPPPGMPHVPTFGPFVGNGFSLINTYPYLIDTTKVNYGQILSYSENVNTYVTRRADASCINLVAKFSMVDNTLTNTVLNDFLKKYIAHDYESLQGVLPVLKSPIKFKIYYTITDYSGGVMSTDTIEVLTDDTHFHFTDVKDMYVTSIKGLVVKTIPAMTYGGEYTLTLDKIEAYIEYLDTKKYVQVGANPFYQFSDNNMKIALQHDIINNTPSDGVIKLAECVINQSFDYVANVTNRVKLSFTSFMSNLIAAPDTLDIWTALNTPTEEIIASLQAQVAELYAKDEAQQLLIQTLANRLDALEGQVTLNKNNIAANTRDISMIKIKDNEQDDRITNLEERVTVIESRPLALNKYQEGQHFVASQLTWNGYGNVYQSTRSFNANGDFDTDVAAGNLVVVATDAAGIAPIASHMTVIDGEIASLDTRVTDIEEKELSKNKLVVKNLTTNEKQYVTSYADAAAILKTDNDGSYKLYPGEGFADNSITESLFENVASLTEIEFVSNMTLGKKAFYNSGLTSITLDSNISSMGTDVCGECTSLTTVVIDNSSLTINSGSFMNCTNLVNVTIISVYKLETSAFYNTGISSVSVPSTCTFINTGVFSKCLNLTSITIDATDIADHVVSSSSALETIELLSHVSTMNGSAFEGAPSGITINIHKSQDTIAGSPWGAVNATINWNVN